MHQCSLPVRDTCVLQRGFQPFCEQLGIRRVLKVGTMQRPIYLFVYPPYFSTRPGGGDLDRTGITGHLFTQFPVFLDFIQQEAVCLQQGPGAFFNTLFQLIAGLLQTLPDSIAFLQNHHQHQRGEGIDTHEHLQQQQRFIQIGIHKRAIT